jgi:hypothetical protein
MQNYCVFQLMASITVISGPGDCNHQSSSVALFLTDQVLHLATETEQDRTSFSLLQYLEVMESRVKYLRTK